MHVKARARRDIRRLFKLTKGATRARTNHRTTVAVESDGRDSCDPTECCDRRRRRGRLREALVRHGSWTRASEQYVSAPRDQEGRSLAEQLPAPARDSHL